MRGIVALLMCMVAAGVAAGEINSIEEIDIQKLFNNDDRVKAALACLMDQAPCGDMQKLRDSIPQLVETNCNNCTPKQKEKYDQVTKVLAARYPEQFKQLAQKYSPKNDK